MTTAAKDRPFGDRRWLLILALVALTVIAYQPVRHAGFVWDDDQYVTDNLTLRNLEGLKRIWFDLSAEAVTIRQYYPLTHTSFWVEYHLWGLNPVGYHVVNVSLHALNAILVWLVLRKLQVKGAWFAAAIFAVHPVHVESVAWVTERKNVLSGFFYLNALLAYLHFLRIDEDSSDFSASIPSEVSASVPRKPLRFYWLAFALFLCALCAKTVTCTLPLVILLLVWWKRGRIGWRDVWRILPFLALSIAMGLTTRLGETVGPEGWNFSLAERFLIAGRNLWFYAGKLIWPQNLAFVYPRWEINPGLWSQYLYPLAAVGVIVALWVLRNRWGRGPLVAVLFFAGTLAVALGFFNIFYFRYSFVADHFQYLASLGIIVLVAACAAQRLEAATPSQRQAGLLLGGGLLATLAVLTMRQSAAYAHPEALYRTTIAKNPAAWMAHNNLGGILLDHGQLDEAIQQLHEVLRYKTDDAGVYNNLGTALFRQGRFGDAAVQYEQAVRLDPGDAVSHLNLGNALWESGRYDEASVAYENALRLKPDFAEAHYNLANTRLRQGRPAEALDQYVQAVQCAPGDAEARFALAGFLAQQGHQAEAAVQYQQAVQIKPDYAAAHYNLANTLVRLGHPTEAIVHYRLAIRLQPDLFAARFNLATALLREGNAPEAVHHLQQVLTLKPDLAEAHYKLGVAWVRLGNFESATNCCDGALRLNAELPQALADCAWLLATHEGAASRDVKRAIEFGKRVCSLTRTNEPAYLDALAAAYAADGQFVNAVMTAEKALALAGAAGAVQLRDQIGQRLDLYRAGHPYRTVLPAPLPSDW